MTASINCQNYIKKTTLLSLIQNNQKNQNLFIGYKNHNLVIQEATEAIVIASGLKSAHQICGLTDYELPYPSVTLAAEYITEDKKVLDGSKLTILDVVPLGDQPVLAITTRLPVTDDQFAIIGSAFLINRISNNPTLKALAQLKMRGPNKYGLSLILNEENILADENEDTDLSKKEFEILWLLARGLSSKKIAEFLYRSPRTIEDHINNIKIKYACSTKAEVIEKAIDNGVLNYLPIGLAKSRRILYLF